MSTAIKLFAEPDTRGEIVAANVRALAAMRGYNQLQLGRVIGMAQGAISARWRGERRWQLDELDTVAAALGVTIFDLIAGGDELTYAKPHRGLTPVGSAARSKGLEPPTF